MQLKKLLLSILCIFTVIQSIQVYANPEKARSHRNKAIAWGIGAGITGGLFTAYALYNWGKSLGVLGTGALFSIPIATFCTYHGYKNYNKYRKYRKAGNTETFETYFLNLITRKK
jgi:hypothetical protein